MRRLWEHARQKGRSSKQSDSSVSASPPLPIITNTPQGLEVVYDGNDAIVDIIAVHGLNGHRQKTWTAANNVHWLRDLLPHDLPRARIMCWGYDANTHDSSRVSCQYLYDHARTLVSDLCRKRQLTSSTRRPIIFVAHSLGGIVVKSALIHSDASRQGALLEHRSIKLCTYGIIFMGTPHQGGNGVQLGRLLVNIASVFVAADNHILQHLERDSEWLQQQLGQYGPITNDFVTKYAYEAYETATAFGRKIMVVPRASAVVPGHANAESIVIHHDHINMVKFISKEDNGYEKISGYLQIMVVNTGDQIRQRWEEEARITEARTDPAFSRWFLPLSLSGVTEVAHFVAREEELAQTHEILRANNRRRTAVLYGLGGMGKTQLAAAYIKRHHADYSAVIWLNAKDATSLKQSFAHVAGRISQQHPSTLYIENAIKDKDLDQITEAVKRWLGETHNSRWLAIYDNYDNPKFPNSTSGPESSKEIVKDESGAINSESQISLEKGFDIRPFFPSSYQGAILITTRSSIVQLGKIVRLGKLTSVHDSLQILASTSHRQGLNDDDAALQLAQRLDGLPLALSTAGSYLSQVSTSWAEYLELYNKSWLRLQESSPQLLTYDYAMYTTWDISYRHIERDSKTATKLLQLWAYFDNEDLWFELLQSGASDASNWLLQVVQDRLSFDQTMRVLCSHGLVEADPPTGKWGTQSNGYSVHGCVHSWMVHVLNKGTNEDMSELAMRCIASHAPSTDVTEYWLVQRRLLRHADRCHTMLAKTQQLQNREWIPAVLGNLYAVQGRLKEAEDMYNRALQGKEKAWGPEHTSTLDTVNNLGFLYANQSRWKEAEDMYHRALQGYEKALGPEHTSTLDTVNNIGLLYKSQGRLKEAEDMYNRALQGYEKALGVLIVDTYPPALNTLENLGDLLRDVGRLEEAQKYYLRAEGGVRLVYGSESEKHRRLSSKLQVHD
ncbi:unnamed protein product [Clonostachys rhizophaga]|uniref:DUF676 domain-containing protein n=1 Tax=Clonostachys rhizophaga TaxID=160324 RepID=A0A9N9YIL8_9HYPO|nr:unnamed protein product [Clonostachys rhizophaga]